MRGMFRCLLYDYQACNIAIIENISKNSYNFFLQLQIIFLHANPREMGQID